MQHPIRLAALAACCGAAVAAPAREATFRDEAAAALSRAAAFFRDRLAVEGGCLWRYSEDLARREGEGKAGPFTVWVQPPGTPTAGLALLRAFEATGDRAYRDAAVQAARCLVRGQLRSGGWTYRIELDPADRKEFAYRVDPPPKSAKARNVTTFDDNTTQAALRLLMRVDRALEFKDATIHEAAGFALDAVLKAQYPVGAWPQGYAEFPDPARFPVRPASYPDAWSRTPDTKAYWHCYTLNDNVLADLVDVCIEASRVYGDPRYRAAAERAGGFLLLAQMPEPQPAWAQQYDAGMRPCWARKFEPPAVTGGESQGALRTLLRLHQETGDAKFLEPIPRALAYLRRSALPDGRLARFYELKTNRPLYFTRQYELTHDDGDLPTHYAFKVSNGLDAIEQAFKQAKAGAADDRRMPPIAELERRARDIVGAMDAQGRWVEEGRLKYHGPDDPARRIIDCGTFARNVEALADYLAATRP